MASKEGGHSAFLEVASDNLAAMALYNKFAFEQVGWKFNQYTDVDSDRYESTHPNAISDGDEYGRGDSGKGVGTKTDKQKVKTLLYSSGNKYKPGSGYNNLDYNQQYW